MSSGEPSREVHEAPRALRGGHGPGRAPDGPGAGLFPPAALRGQQGLRRGAAREEGGPAGLAAGKVENFPRRVPEVAPLAGSGEPVLDLREVLQSGGGAGRGGRKG